MYGKHSFVGSDSDMTADAQVSLGLHVRHMENALR